MPGRAQAGEAFIVEGDRADHFFNVTEGTARLFKSLPDGRRQITGFAGRGHFLGLAVSGSSAFTAEAVEPMQFCRFSRRRLRTLLDDFPAFETRLLEVASNELVAAQAQMLLLGRKTAREHGAGHVPAGRRARRGKPVLLREALSRSGRGQAPHGAPDRALRGRAGCERKPAHGPLPPPDGPIAVADHQHLRNAQATEKMLETKLPISRDQAADQQIASVSASTTRLLYFRLHAGMTPTGFRARERDPGRFPARPRADLRPATGAQSAR